MKEALHASYTIVRPFLLPVLGAGGLYLAVEELRQSPLHHNTVIWVVGFGLAGAAVLGLYKEIRNRLLLRRWLALRDRAELLEKLPQVRKAVADLPPWNRSRYLDKKREIDELPAARAPHEETAQRAIRKGLAQRLRHSALFVLSVLILGAVGAFAFLQWLQIVVSEFGSPAPWLITWVLVATYFLVVGAAVVVDALKRRYRRLDSVAHNE